MKNMMRPRAQSNRDRVQVVNNNRLNSQDNADGIVDFEYDIAVSNILVE